MGEQLHLAEGDVFPHAGSIMSIHQVAGHPMVIKRCAVGRECSAIDGRIRNGVGFCVGRQNDEQLQLAAFALSPAQDILPEFAILWFLVFDLMRVGASLREHLDVTALAVALLWRAEGGLAVQRIRAQIGDLAELTAVFDELLVASIGA